MEPAYLFIRTHIHDLEKMKEYGARVAPITEKFGGVFIVRGGEVVCMEGSYDECRVVVIRFPSKEKLLEFWNSEEYAPVRKIRHSASKADIWMVPGIPEKVSEKMLLALAAFE
jgi:uncharacterized protein (DUF1330 family)